MMFSRAITCGGGIGQEILCALFILMWKLLTTFFSLALSPAQFGVCWG